MGCNTTYLGTSKYLAKLRDARDRDDVAIGEFLLIPNLETSLRLTKPKMITDACFCNMSVVKMVNRSFLSLARMRMWRSYAAVTLCSDGSLSKPKYFSQLMTIASMFCYLKREAEPNRCTKKT